MERRGGKGGGERERDWERERKIDAFYDIISDSYSAIAFLFFLIDANH